jgi:peptide/nickel transport system substrate-binding protein
VKRILFIGSLSLLLLIPLLSSACGEPATTTPSTTPTSPATTTPSTTPTSPATTTPSTTPTITKTAESTVPGLSPQYGGVLRVIKTEGPTGSIGINKNMKGLSAFIQTAQLERFWQLDSLGKVNLQLAEDYKWSNNNLTLTVFLRKGVKFHDGTDFNAEAVLWNLDAGMAAKVDGSENIESYRIIDDYTVEINIKQYNNNWFGKASLGFIISPSWVESHGEEYVDWNPVGTGPFKFKRYKENQYLEWERFDDYWGEKPYLDGIKDIYITDPVTAQIAFEAGEGDVIAPMIGGPQIAAELAPKGYVVEAPASNSYMLIPSVTNPSSPLANLKVREAIEYAIDKVKISERVGLGYFEPLYQYCGTSTSIYDPNFQGRVYDPDKARALLKEAGYPDGFKTKIMASTAVAGDELIAIQDNLRDVNIELEIEIISIPKWIELESYGWPEGIMESSTSSYREYGFVIERYLIKPATPQFFRGLYWDSLARTPKLEELIQEYLRIPIDDTAALTAKGREIVKEVYDNAMAIPLFDMTRPCTMQMYVHNFLIPYYSPSIWNYLECWMEK